MALKKAFWMSVTTTCQVLACGLSSGPPMSACVATSSRGKFSRSLLMPPAAAS
jgi:hypothetical protein